MTEKELTEIVKKRQAEINESHAKDNKTNDALIVISATDKGDNTGQITALGGSSPAMIEAIHRAMHADPQVEHLLSCALKTYYLFKLSNIFNDGKKD